ncbi:hypothetical protein SJAG_01691 [Schizosaccharomyces japonicus yFS275]|uniref:Uncharacterized protein n=1 Tax=Schizosaccharomyces japonicus (strain yFS275 / FY16936) TaxID=402676 RepID=B6JYM6_SCHJY|nr:hypothetical protein SJAG_01691 [Schizosaccharomyces japonicus yFS275]EEB06644.2 hypothetical protein SJAG_01691 [Schizosaccharomyces japonicus yFS275]
MSVSERPPVVPAACPTTPHAQEDPPSGTGETVTFSLAFPAVKSLLALSGFGSKELLAQVKRTTTHAEPVYDVYYKKCIFTSNQLLLYYNSDYGNFTLASILRPRRGSHREFGFTLNNPPLRYKSHWTLTVKPDCWTILSETHLLLPEKCGIRWRNMNKRDEDGLPMWEAHLIFDDQSVLSRVATLTPQAIRVESLSQNIASRFIPRMTIESLFCSTGVFVQLYLLGRFPFRVDKD